jgi:pyrimidine-nucleoside phosphorylase
MGGLVPYLPLITASILSKKIASNADIIVFDVKTGRGAFMKELDETRRLARMLVSTAQLFGKRSSAVITSMENPLGYAVGNSLEVLEAIEFLEGRDIPGLNEVVYSVAGLALTLAGFDEEEAFIQLEAARRSGKALKYFQRMVAALGGPHDLLSIKKKIPRAAVVGVLTSTESRGYVHSIDPLAVSRAVTAASGGGRRPETGVILRVSPGDKVSYDDELCEIHAVDYESLDKAADILEKAFIINESKPAPQKYLLETITEA